MMTILESFEIFPYTKYVHWTLLHVCGYVPDICYFGYIMFGTKSTKYVDAERYQVYLGHTPSGTSLYQITQYLQSYRKQGFRELDFRDKYYNTEAYGSEKVPKLDLKGATKSGKVPIAAFYGLDDPVVDEKDVKWLRSQIEPSLVHWEAFRGGHDYVMCG